VTTLPLPSPRPNLTDEPAPPAACPDENALAEFVQGLADGAVASEIELHLDGCAACRRIISSLGQSSYLAQRVRTHVDSGTAAMSTWSMGLATREYALPPPGEVLAGKYRIERVLGQGGMGVVMAATHLTLGKLVALKLMRSDLAVDASATQRFVREARAASLLRSEHIARVLDLDTLPDGSPYIAMEYLEGEDLGALLVRCGPVSASDAATYIVQVCEAVAEAHAAGIVHRDLKPSNLFLTTRGASPCVKVLDFGISKIIAHGPLTDEVASTDSKALVGSPHYMAPEQLISAKAVDPRTDVWALGCILFELVSGTSPFAGNALAQVLASILRDEPPALDGLRPDLPLGFAQIVARCLDKDPARRYQRVDELATALAPYVGAAPADAATPSPVGSAFAAATAPTPRPGAPRSGRVNARGGWVVFGVVIAVALALAAYRGSRSGAPGVAPDEPVSAPLASPGTAPSAPEEPPVATPPSAVPAGLVPPPPVAAPGALPDVPQSSGAAEQAAASPDPARPPRPRRVPRLEDDLIGPELD
jgi:eukaryotic-like serine/threonine-protein kinase